MSLQPFFLLSKVSDPLPIDLRSAFTRSYKDKLRNVLERIRDRYGLASGPIDYRPELWVQDEQPTLFPLE